MTIGPTRAFGPLRLYRNLRLGRDTPKYDLVYICLTNRVYPDDGKTYGVVPGQRQKPYIEGFLRCRGENTAITNYSNIFLMELTTGNRILSEDLQELSLSELLAKYQPGRPARSACRKKMSPAGRRPWPRLSSKKCARWPPLLHRRRHQRDAWVSWMHPNARPPSEYPMIW